MSEGYPQEDPAAKAAEEVAERPPTPDEVAAMVAEYNDYTSSVFNTGKRPEGVTQEDYEAGVEARRTAVTRAARELGGLGVGDTITTVDLAGVEANTGINFGLSARAVMEGDATLAATPPKKRAHPPLGTDLGTGDGAVVVGSRYGVPVVRDRHGRDGMVRGW